MGFLNGRTFENSQILIDMLSTFWALWFKDKTALTALNKGLGQLYFETYLQTLETFNCVSKETVPVFSRSQWKLLVLKESDQKTADALKYKYGEAGRVYGAAGNYGDQRTGPYYSFPIDEDIQTCTHLYNRLLDPSLVLAHNLDFRIDAENHLIHFLEDPWSNPLIPVRQVLDDDGNTVDRELGLWASNLEIDKAYIYNHFGYVLNIWMQSSDFYKQFVSALWDSLVQGPSKMAVKLVLSAMTGIPFAKEDETIETILSTASAKTIITDKNVYEFKPGVTPVVAVGDHVIAGDALVNTVRVIEPHPTTDWTGFMALSIGRRFMGIPLEGPIVFENKSVNVNYMGVDIEGRAIVTFDVKGWPSDIDAFWKQVHANGIQGKTLAEYLDTRANPINQPDARDLPAHVNPFQFVMNNLFRNNLYVIYMDIDNFADGAPGLSNMVHLYKYLPPHTSFIVFIQSSMGTDQLPMDDLDDSIEFQHALAPSDLFYAGTNDDYMDGMLRDRGIRIKTVPENCR